MGIGRARAPTAYTMCGRISATARRGSSAREGPAVAPISTDELRTRHRAPDRARSSHGGASTASSGARRAGPWLAGAGRAGPRGPGAGAARPCGGGLRERVRRQLGHDLGTAAPSEPANAASTTTIFCPRMRSGIGAMSGSWRMRPTEVTSSGAVRVQAAQRVQDLLRALPGEDQPAGVGALERVHAELERGDHAEVAAAAAQRPEQVGSCSASARTTSPSIVTSSTRGQRVRGQAVQPGQPADAAAQRVAGDADVGRRAVEHGHAVRRGGIHDLLPHDPAAGAGDPRSRSIETSSRPGGLEQQGLGEVADGQAACPVLCGATRRPYSRAQVIASTTSSTEVGWAMAAGSGEPRRSRPRAPRPSRRHREA